MINLRKLTYQRKNLKALTIKNRIVKQTHEKKLARNLSPITKKLDEGDQSTKKIGENVKKFHVEDENTQTAAIENITGTQSLCDTFAPLKRGKFFFKLEDQSIGYVFRNGVFIRPLGEIRSNVKNEEYDVTPDIQKYFTNTKFTTKSLNRKEKETVFMILKKVGFYELKHIKALNSARKKDVLHKLPKTFTKILNPFLPEVENVEDSFEKISDNDLEGQGVDKNIIPSNIKDIYTRLEFLLGKKISARTNTLTEASNLIDELYERWNTKRTTISKCSWQI